MKTKFKAKKVWSAPAEVVRENVVEDEFTAIFKDCDTLSEINEKLSEIDKSRKLNAKIAYRDYDAQYKKSKFVFETFYPFIYTIIFFVILSGFK